MSKISKNIKMLDILSSGKVYSCKKLSEMLEVSTRTIRQYKDELEKEGIYIDSIMGKNGGYKLYSIIDNEKYVFKYLNEIIYVHSNNLFIKMNEYKFLELYSNSTFFVFDDIEEIDVEKDKEYYSWAK